MKCPKCQMKMIELDDDAFVCLGCEHDTLRPMEFEALGISGAFNLIPVPKVFSEDIIGYWRKLERRLNLSP